MRLHNGCAAKDFVDDGFKGLIVTQ